MSHCESRREVHPASDDLDVARRFARGGPGQGGVRLTQRQEIPGVDAGSREDRFLGSRGAVDGGQPVEHGLAGCRPETWILLQEFHDQVGQGQIHMAR